MGKEYLPLPKRERDTYSATEISKLPAKRYNIQLSSKMIGKVANVNHLKTEAYGVKVWDKSRYSNKQVESFRYYDSILEPLIIAYNQRNTVNQEE